LLTLTAGILRISYRQQVAGSNKMPEGPNASVLVKYVFENPWPLSLILLVVAIVAGWTGLREGMPRRVSLAGVLGALAAAILLIGFLVETSGERAKSLVRDFVEAVVRKDLVVASGHIADAAVLSAVSPDNPGLDADAILEGLCNFTTRYTIESNDITMLRGFTEDSETATVHLGCYTIVDFPTISKWVLQVRKHPDGEWKITRITCISINDRTPSLDWMR
jgi:hypothetical protein